MKDKKILTPFPMGKSASIVVAAFPGRLKTNPPRLVPPKPTEDETPYRSKMFVSSRNSADGNEYAKGAPIPEAERQRQGDQDENPITSNTVTEGIERPKRSRDWRPPRPADNWGRKNGTCGFCQGTGRRSPNTTRSHKEDCKCVGCKPCKHCDGTKLRPPEPE